MVRHHHVEEFHLIYNTTFIRFPQMVSTKILFMFGGQRYLFGDHPEPFWPGLFSDVMKIIAFFQEDLSLVVKLNFWYRAAPWVLYASSPQVTHHNDRFTEAISLANSVRADGGIRPIQSTLTCMSICLSARSFELAIFSPRNCQPHPRGSFPLFCASQGP